MIISHKYKFIFIKTSKTAGSSIEAYLSSVCDKDDVFSEIWPANINHQPRNFSGYFNPFPEVHSHFVASRYGHTVRSFAEDLRGTLRHFSKRKMFINHLPGRVIRCRVSSRVWNSYFKFCVERNPWDKCVSKYHMVKGRSGKSLLFEEFIRRNSLPSNISRYTDEHGKLLVDRVLRYEKLNQELSDLFFMLKIPFEGVLGVHEKASFRSDKSGYQHYYDSASAEIVRSKFAHEIDLFNYEF